jgi:hypothetical protein
VYGMTPEKVRTSFADSAIVEQARDRKRETKVLALIKDAAVYVDTIEDAADDAQAETQGAAGEDKGSEE